VRRSFFVCFWYDLSAAWKTAWKRESEEEAAVVAGVGDMTRACDRRGTYEIRRRIGDGENEDREHRAEGAHRRTPPYGYDRHLKTDNQRQ
jgi:hypothetical protein